MVTPRHQCLLLHHSGSCLATIETQDFGSNLSGALQTLKELSSALSKTGPNLFA